MNNSQPAVGVNAYEFDQIVVGATQVTATPSKILTTAAGNTAGLRCRALECTNEGTNAIRIRYDSPLDTLAPTPPVTAAIGIRIAGGSSFRITGQNNVASFRAIQAADAAGSATLTITYLD